MKQREIKFRAWDKENKKMSFGKCDGGDYILDFDGDVMSIDLDCPDGGIGGSNVILMQYTGLKDKNGKEIYEGDIVKWIIFTKDCDSCSRREKEEKVGKIVFGSGNYWGSVEEILTSIFDIVFKEPKGAEVIGNIYENKDLIK